MAPDRRVRFAAAHLVLLLAATLLLVSVAVAWWRLEARTEDVRRAQAVLRHLDRLLVAERDLASAELTFVLSGDERDLAPAEHAIAALDDAVRLLIALTDGPEERRRVAVLRDEVAELVERASLAARDAHAALATGQTSWSPEAERRARAERIAYLVDELDDQTTRRAAFARAEREEYLRTLVLLAVGSALGLAVVLPMAFAGRGDERTQAARLRHVAASGVVGMAFWDTTGRLVESNAEYDRIVGMPAGSRSAPVYWTEVFVGDHRRLADAAARQVLVDGACRPFFATCRGDGAARITVLSWSIRLETEPAQFASFVVDLSHQLAAGCDPPRVDGFTALAATTLAADVAMPTALATPAAV